MYVIAVTIIFADKYFVYVSDCSGHCIEFVVYETSGQFVKSFGRNGAGEGEFCYPFCSYHLLC